MYKSNERNMKHYIFMSFFKTLRQWQGKKIENFTIGVIELRFGQVVNPGMFKLYTEIEWFTLD